MPEISFQMNKHPIMPDHGIEFIKKVFIYQWLAKASKLLDKDLSINYLSKEESDQEKLPFDT